MVATIAETGDFQAKVREHRGKNNKITDWEKFRVFAETHGDKTQVEMAQLWDEQISDTDKSTLRERTISRALKKIGLTRKKRLTDTVKEMNNYAKLLSNN